MSYKEAAEEFIEAGIPIFPCEGKKPLVRWRSVGLPAAKKFANDPKYASKNLAFQDGKNITRVDIDDPALINDALVRFGDTPVKVITPKGGMHLYYRASGEKRQIKLGGQAIDILGEGGYGIAPPSRLNNGEWRFIEGGIKDLGNLPPIKKGALFQAESPGKRGQIKKGARNDKLFRECCLKRFSVETRAELLLWAQGKNEYEVVPPLPDREVETIVNSVWKYKQNGTAFQPGKQQAKLNMEEIKMGFENPRAIVLYAYLRANHFKLRQTFFGCQSALAEITGWDRKTIRGLLDYFEKRGLLICVGCNKAGVKEYTFGG